MSGERARIVVRGVVQGVGFRPFVYRLATELGVTGYVLNSGEGVFIEIEGERAQLDQFLLRFPKEIPLRAAIHSLETSFLDRVGYSYFEICQSEETTEKTAIISPDIATCADCVREMFDSSDRRFRYPFTNCINCGPRFSIIESLPYDRTATSMKKFTMCLECEREYHDPINRRFHAQPNACPQCGPQLQLWNAAGNALAQFDQALIASAEIVRAGKILALKGLGGFQLIVDARNESAVVRLRERKHREEKPLAVMFPSLEAARKDCVISEIEERLLLSPESPIVLLQRVSVARNQCQPGSDQCTISSFVAPGNPNLGVMLPYTPLHFLLMRELNSPIVATSGNLSDEPICIDNDEALERLHDVADAFLLHDRPIVRQIDDSIVRVIRGREMLLRRARGYAPLPLQLKQSQQVLMAVGAHLKNTVALSIGDNVFVSQHIGDLETQQAYAAFRKISADLPRLYEVKPEAIACDLHPDYLSTKFAEESGLPVHRVQHHVAHVIASLAENEVESPALGIAWDGTGYGRDATVWGGEFFRVESECVRRVAHLRTFRLPGGDVAAKEPRRCALGILFEICGSELWHRKEVLDNFRENEIALLRQMLKRKLNAPLTSSAGRLFDAVASFTGLRQRSNFEGQAAMEVEFASDLSVSASYPFDLVMTADPIIIDWKPMITRLLTDRDAGVPVGEICAKFHNTLVQIIVSIARKIGETKVVLSGGCFQNRLLTEGVIDSLISAGFRVYWPQRVPPNDGGIALGQIIAASQKYDEAVNPVG